MPGTEVTTDEIREAVARELADEFWQDTDTARIIIEDPAETEEPGRWTFPGTFETIRGFWYVDGPEIDILINEDEKA